MLFSVTKDVLKWTNGILEVNATSSEVVATVDSGYKISGRLTSCESIRWNNEQLIEWQKVPEVEEVHVVFMNHLDVGYDGIKRTGFINNVLNVYFDTYFPRAISLAAELSMNASSNRQLIYTTHPWLVYLYLHCPVNFTLNNITLHCPTTDNVSAFENSIRKGYIRWHAGPMNIQMELMNEKMLDVAMWISAQLDKTYLKKSGNYTRVWSLRDVPGMTKSVIGYFLKNGIVALSVGVNPSSAPPDLPDMFLWKESESDEDGLIAFWSKGGYPGVPGSSLDRPIGLAIRRTVFSRVDKQALVFAFRTDNKGPPEDVVEIASVYDVVEKEYPNAAVHASTFEGFVSKISKSSLPVVTNEVGDNWIQGVASDPRKVALYRAAVRALQCAPPDCSWGWDAVKDFAWYLTKLPEHTWGLNSVYDNINWSNKDFHAVRKNSSNFVAVEQSWLEQREFFNMTLEMAMKSSSSQWYVDNLKKELSGIYPSLPSLDGYKEGDIAATYLVNTTGGHLKLGFLKNGAIGELVYTGQSGSTMTLASEDSALGLLQYYTYNGTDYDFMNSRYTYYGNAGYEKPLSDKIAHPNSTESVFYVQSFYTNASATVEDKWHFMMELVGDHVTHTFYGSPETVWILVKAGPSSASNALFEMDFEVTLFNKTATRLAEATMFSFAPYGSNYRGFYQKISDASSIPFESVVLNGSQYQHAVESVTLVGPDLDGNGSVTIKLSSLDVAVVCPVLSNTTYKTPTPFPAPEDPVNIKELKGVAFNIHNNVWNTNYPLWYPFVEEDKDFKSRYTMTFFENVDKKTFLKHYL